MARTLSRESIGLICCCIAASAFLIFPQSAISMVAGITSYAIHEFGLAFIIIPSLFVILAFAIALSPWGKITLGKDKSPEFSFISWVSMLFAAGMGSGLIFWGVAEPIAHYANPPAFIPVQEVSKDTALALTYFHWGLHAWSLYAISGLVMAWFAFNKSRSMTVSASFTDKKTSNGYQLFDLLAVIAVIFGVAGTLANTIALVQSGLEQSLGFDIGGISFRLGLLMAITFAFTLSSTLGLDKGIRRMSLFNLLFVIAILIAVVALVDPLAVVTTIFTSSLSYLQLLPAVSFSIDEGSRGWSEGWSIIYFVWWIAWAPFVGPFIARISRGRTIRQYLLCTILVPTVTTIVWFSTFGGSVFEMSILPDVVQATNTDFTLGLFTFFDSLVFGKVLTYSAILLLITFVITSADSAIYVTGMMTGNQAVKSKLIWSLVLVAITAALVLKNNIDLNKQIAIFGALPFTLILLAQAGIMVKELVKHKR
ncbi:BCCT family transporter [Shewanella eurypsychrophilus]|uniref:BCCT family transporter n=2 Tax=Shewanellaceae TaxID=267890 RepID=A0ABX6VDC3_9GAMM|nr:BCCT transporter [Shewanella sp. YLB-09]QPG60368.1 BCCT family transporter [Shewanella eurypsychrophilus]